MTTQEWLQIIPFILLAFCSTFVLTKEAWQTTVFPRSEEEVVQQYNQCFKHMVVIAIAMLMFLFFVPAPYNTVLMFGLSGSAIGHFPYIWKLLKKLPKGE